MIKRNAFRNQKRVNFPKGIEFFLGTRLKRE